MILKFRSYLLLGLFSVVSILAWGQKNEACWLSAKYQQMGTSWQIKACMPSSDQSYRDQLSDTIKQLIDSLNTIFSDYDPDSELNRATAQAHQQPVVLSSPLTAVIEQSLAIARQTGGAFDISIGPLSRLWRRAFRRQVFPEKEAIRAARRKVNYRWIQLEGNTLRLKRPGMRLDLGGIAKGKTVDYIADLLENQGITHYLIDGGGDIRVLGHPPNQSAWRIELPGGAVREMNSGAIATSGDQYRYLEYQGQRYSHLIDPRTGYGVQGQHTVTVAASTAAAADAWASVCSIVPPHKARRMLQNTNHHLFYLPK